jgi:hypothetical protein
MYQIDLDTATAADVIRRSIVCHPAVLADKLNANARIHYQAAGQLVYDRAAASSARMAGDHAKGAALRVDMRLDNYTTDQIVARIVGEFGEMIAAFGAAAQLQCMPFAASLDIVERGAKP